MQISPLPAAAAPWEPQIDFTTFLELQLSRAQHPRHMPATHTFHAAQVLPPLHRMHMCKYLLFQLQQHLGNPRLISQLFWSYNFLAHSIPATCLQHTHFLQPGLAIALLRFWLTLFDQLKKNSRGSAGLTRCNVLNRLHRPQLNLQY